jgi:hypothetical protein
MRQDECVYLVRDAEKEVALTYFRILSNVFQDTLRTFAPFISPYLLPLSSLSKPEDGGSRFL